MDQTVTVYQLAEQGPQRIQMNSFIVRTPNAHLIVLDGGNVQDHEYLLNTLRALGGEKPVVDAWLFTHAHADHVDAFVEIWRDHRFALDVGSIWFHFPAEVFIEQNDDADSLQSLKRFNALIPSFEGRTHIVRAGDVLEVDGVRFTALCEPDESFPMNCMNNTSVVYRMEAAGQRILFLGDLGEEAGERLLARLGARGLGADIVQMAHHGQNGVRRSFYEAVRPKACLWCTPQWLWDNDAGQGYNTHLWKTVEVRGWMEELGVKIHFATKDGTHTIELPLDLSGGED